MAATSTSFETRQSGASSPSTWNRALLLLVIAIVAYFETWVEIWPYWEGKNGLYSHGTLVALIAGWLIWRARAAVNVAEPKPSALAVPVVLLLSAVWLLAERANIFIIYASLWPILAFSVIWAGLGLRAASEFSAPLGFLYFAIPFWDYLRPPLQAITSTMVGWLTHLFGLPAALDGHYIILPTARLFIAEDCSGAYFLSIALAVGFLASILRQDTTRTRVLVLIIAGLLSLVFNWIRILLIAVAYLNPDLRNMMDWMGGHELLGWFVFAFGLVVFGLVVRFVPRSPNWHADSQPSNQRRSSQRNERTGLWMSIGALLLLPAITWALPRFDTYTVGAPGDDLGFLGLQATVVAPDLRWSPYYPGTIWERRLAIVADTGTVIEVYGNRYHGQTQGNELVSNVSHLFDPTTFLSGPSTIVTLQGSQDKLLQARREVLSHTSGDSWLTLYTYVVDSDSVTGSLRAQLVTALRSMHSRSAAGIIAVATPCIEDCDSRTSDIENTFIALYEQYRDSVSE